MKTVEKKLNELYSFDIFDTLITRKCATPKGIFAFMQEAITNNNDLPQNLRENFYKIRIESEIQARNDYYEKHQTREILFDEIYEKMQKDFNLSNKSIDYLKKLEIETELKNLVGISENIEKIKQLIKDEKRVVLISDMYHSSNTIRTFLAHIDPIFNDIKIYVSSEYRASKAQGDLYSKVREIEGIKKQNWYHLGDNLHSDFKMAKKIGIKAERYLFEELMPYEKELLSKNPVNTDYEKLIAAARFTRCNKQAKIQDKYNFGASFAGPFLYNYVNDILEQSLKKGFKTLHFIARDGYIPKVIADIIIEKRGLDIKTKYIYGSRLAWRIPYEENYEHLIDVIFDEYKTKISLSFIAYRLCVDVNVLKDKLNATTIDTILNDKERLTYKEQMKSDKSIRNYILEANKDKKENLTKYLHQEIDFNKKNIAFVEVNGSGRTQNFLTEFINTISPKAPHQIHTFYITTSTIDEEEPLSVKYTFCVKPKPHYHTLELLCRTYDGQTIGYKQEGNKVLPIFEKINNSALADWGFDDYLNGIKDFVENALKLGIYSANVEFCYTYFDYLVFKYDRDLSTIIGDIPFLPIGNESNTTMAAPEISPLTIFKMIITRQPYEKFTYFPFLSIARGNKYTNFIKRHLFELTNIPNWLLEVRLFTILYKNRNKKIILYGASIFLEDFIKKYKLNLPNIVGIVDKNPNRQGKRIGNYNIVNLDAIEDLKPDCMLLTIKNMHGHIYHDLKLMVQKDFPNIKLLPNFFEI